MTSGDALIQDFIAGRYRLRETGAPAGCPIRAIVTASSLAGQEAGLVARVGIEGRIGMASDENTHEVLGRQVARAVLSSG